MSAITGQVLWGSWRPRFRLVPPESPGRRVRTTRQPDRLPGTFTFTNAISTVSTSDDMNGVLLPDDAISQDRSKYYIVKTIDSTTQITLTANFNEATAGDSVAYLDRALVWMPLTALTELEFHPETRRGGALQTRNNNGEIRTRVDGFRVIARFQWDFLYKEEFERLVSVFNHQVRGGYEVIPHDDVAMSFKMHITVPLASGRPGGKAVGHTADITFESDGLVANVPLLGADANWRPLGSF